jgi:2-dehydropantoate 2-reductase
MKFAVVGAGAVGGFLGGRLAKAGEDVTLIARGAHLEAMRQRGLTVIEYGGEYVVQAVLTDDINAVANADVIFVTVKAHSMPAVAKSLGTALAPGAVVVSTQNGIPWWYFQRLGGEFDGIHLESVDPGGLIGETINPKWVVGCIPYPAVELIRPGIVRLVEGDRFSLGELDGRETERCSAISQVLIRAGLKAPVQQDIRAELWLKLLGNAVFNPISALTRATLGDIAESPLTAQVVRSAMEEVRSVAQALGVEIPVSIDRRIRGAARVGAHKTSMLQDLEAGRPLEIDAVTGAVVELGDRLGLALPYLRTLRSCVALLDRQHSLNARLTIAEASATV